MKIALVDRSFLPRFRDAIIHFLAAWPPADAFTVYAEEFRRLPAVMEKRLVRRRFAHAGELNAMLREEAPDIIVSMYGLVATARLAEAFHGQIPVVWLLQGVRDVQEGLLSPRRADRVSQLRERLSGIIASCDLQRQCLLRHGFAESRIHVVPPAVELGAPTRAPSPRLIEPRVVWIGRPIARKGFALFGTAMKAVAGSWPHLEAVAVGPRREDPRELGPHLRCLGPLEHGPMLKVLRNADLLVHSANSLADGSQEAIPQVILESMALSVPVLAIDCGAVREVVLHQETGWLSHAREPAALAGDIARFLADPELRLHCASRARAFVERCFERRHAVALMRETLSKLALEGGG